MDNIQKYSGADEFLHDLGLRIHIDVVIKVLNVITGETPGSLYDLYSWAERRDGTSRTPICGKGTVDKIKRLYQTGKMDSFLNFVHYKAHEFELNTLIANFEKKKTGQEARATFRKLIGDWESEICLPLQFLDIEDLSRGNTGVNIGRDTILIWELLGDGSLERRFGIEGSSEFRKLQETLSKDIKLWGTFQECKRIGGSLIKECSSLINDIREQSESKTGLKYMARTNSGPENPRLDRYFAWTVYADALGVLPEARADRMYRFIDMGIKVGELFWGDFMLAIVSRPMTDVIKQQHSELRSRYRKSVQVRLIRKLKSQYDNAETRLRKELEIIRQGLSEY